MSLSCFSSIGAGLSIKQMIASFTGNIILPLAASNTFSTADVTSASINVTNMGLYNGTYTIGCGNNYNGSYTMGYAFGNITAITSTNFGWYSKSLDTPANLSTFNVVHGNGTVQSINAVYLQIQLPYFYANLYSYNILSAIKWAYNQAQRMPRIFYILGSDNNTNWYVLDYVSNALSTALPTEIYGGIDMSSNKALIKKDAYFNYIRIATLDTYEPGAPSDRPVLITQFYANGTPVTLFNSLQLFYRFNSYDIYGNTNLGNFATQSFVYDASLSTTGLITANNTLSLSTTGNVIINKPSISTDASGVSFSFSMKMSPSTSYTGNSSVGVNPIFDFGNGPGSDNIVFGTVGNKIYTNITSGNTAVAGNITFGTYTNTNFTTGGDDIQGMDISLDGNTLVYANNTGKKIYYATYNGTLWSSAQLIGTITGSPSGTPRQVAINGNGSRIVGAYTNSAGSSGGYYYTNWNGNGYNALTFVDTGTVNWLIAMTADGNRIVFGTYVTSGTTGKVYYGTWDGIISPTPTYADTGLANQLGQVGIGLSQDGNILAVSANSVNIRIATWNGSGYTLTQTITISYYCSRITFSNDNNVIFVTDYGNAILYFGYRTGNGTYSTLINSGVATGGPSLTGVVLSFDQKTLYPCLNYTFTALKSLSINMSRTQTNTNIYNVAINDDTWRDYLWTISSTGTYTYYVNGSQVYQSTSGLVVPTVSRTLNYIGKSNSKPASYFGGEIDNFRMFNRVLDINEIKYIYNKSPNVSYFYVSNTTSSVTTVSFVRPPQDFNYYDLSAVPAANGITISDRLNPSMITYDVSNVFGTYNIYLSASNIYGRSLTKSLSVNIPVSQSYSINAVGSINNSSTNYATITTATNAVLGASTFTIECWMYATSSTVTQGIMGFGPYSGGSTTNGRLTIFYNFPGFTGQIYVQNGADGTFIRTSAIPQNTLFHFALVRDGAGLTKIYINGTADGTSTTWTTNFNNNNWSLFRDYSDLNQEYFVGDLSVIKISNYNFYSTNFTPSFKQFNNDAATLLLLNVASSGALLTNSSNYVHTITNNGLIYGIRQSYSTAISYSLDTTYSGAFGPGYAYGTLSQSIGTQPFSIEFWFLPMVGDTNQGILGLGGNDSGSTTNGRLTLFYSGGAANQITVVNAAGGSISTATNSIGSASSWYHIAIVRDNSNLVKIYVNGTQNGTTATWTTNFNNTSFIFGRAYYDVSSNYCKMYMSVLKLSTYPFYLANFTPQKKMYNSDSATLLLLNVADVSATNKYLTDSSSYNISLSNGNTNNLVAYSGVYKPV